MFSVCLCERHGSRVFCPKSLVENTVYFCFIWLLLLVETVSYDLFVLTTPSSASYNMLLPACYLWLSAASKLFSRFLSRFEVRLMRRDFVISVHSQTNRSRPKTTFKRVLGSTKVYFLERDLLLLERYPTMPRCGISL